MAKSNPTGSKRTRLSAEEARQGRILLTTPLRRAIFIGGLVGIVLLVLFFAIVAR
jgi:hypothetical protein